MTTPAESLPSRRRLYWRVLGGAITTTVVCSTIWASSGGYVLTLRPRHGLRMTVEPR